METQVKQTPQSLAELAQALLELANHVERVTDGLQAKDSAQIVDRMLRDGADDYIGAFHGLTYAWIIAVMPELEDVMSLDGKTFSRRAVVLESRSGFGFNRIHNRFEFSLPKTLDYVDGEWSGREVGE